MNGPPQPPKLIINNPQPLPTPPYDRSQSPEIPSSDSSDSSGGNSGGSGASPSSSPDDNGMEHAQERRDHRDAPHQGGREEAPHARQGLERSEGGTGAGTGGGGGGGGGQGDLQVPAVARPRPPVDQYGFYVKDASAVSLASNASASKRPGKEKQSLAQREQAWLDLLAHWDAPRNPKKRRKDIKKLGRAGIPESLRAKAWSALANVQAIREPGLFDGLLAQRDDIIFEIIERDISRCFPEHSMFSEEGGVGQTNLRNVLRAYAMYNPDIGYCQGMGMLAGMMLMHMPPEDTFWLLAATLKDILKDFYTPVLLQLRRDAAVFEALLYKTSKPLARHMDQQDVSPLMYITQWFLTVYTTSLPWETALRVWDMVFCEGVKPLFRIGLAILRVNKDTLLRECPTNAEILSLLLHLPRESLEAEPLIKQSMKVKIRKKDIWKLRDAVARTEIPDRGTISLVKKKKK